MSRQLKIQTNLDQVDALSARYRTLTYEHERLQKTYAGTKTNGMKQQTEIEGWKARCADLEKRLGNEEAKVKELREEVVRGRKAIDGVRVAASVSHCSQLVPDH
jgi:predicted RNase H-like nuclease (RuvC/YqgF family)